MWTTNHLIGRCAALALCLACWPDAHARDISNYQFPEQSAVRSTVLGTPDALISPLAKPGEIRERTYYLDLHKPGLERFKEQHRRGVDRLSFSLAYQKRPAPLIVSIAGTGGDHASGKAQLMKRILYRAGFHVLSLSSPTNPDFLFAASSTNHAGISPKDAEDLYLVIQRALRMISKKIKATDYYLTGYSLGALNAAFVSRLDHRRQKVRFTKVLLINPPVNLITSVTNLTEIVTSDELLRRTGSRSIAGFIDPIVHRMAQYFKASGQIDLTGDAMYRIAEGAHLSDFELRVLVRIAFGFSVADMVFTTDALNQYGYIVPKGQAVSMLQSNGNIWLKHALTWTFLDYFRLMVLPYWQGLHPEDSEADVVVAWSLLGLRDYLANQTNIRVQHNTDDIILGAGDIEFIRETFGDRALIYPAGGHCGNMAHRKNVDDMLSFFKG